MGMTTITWQVPDDAMASLEAYRQALTVFEVVDGRTRSRPKYASVEDMVVGVAIEHLAAPAFAQFPPASISAAKAAADEAAAAYEAHRSAVLFGLSRRSSR